MIRFFLLLYKEENFESCTYNIINGDGAGHRASRGYSIWRSGSLSVSQALILSIIGNLIPVPALIIFTKRVFAWLRTKSEGLNAFVCKMEAKAESKKETVEKYEFFGLMLLVAIPLPGTGAWTGCLVAAMMELDFKKAFPAVVLGVVIAGLIVSWLTSA